MLPLQGYSGACSRNCAVSNVRGDLATLVRTSRRFGSQGRPIRLQSICLTSLHCVCADGVSEYDMTEAKRAWRNANAYVRSGQHQKAIYWLSRTQAILNMTAKITRCNITKCFPTLASPTARRQLRGRERAQ
jgi:hypothetical protein